MASQKPLAISEVNKMELEEFVALLGNVVEHSTMCAAAVWGCRPFKSSDHLQASFESLMDQLPELGKLGILRLYPDLAGSLSKSGGLTLESQKEHTAAGLDRITDADRNNMADLNAKYKRKFDFTFVICSRENKVAAILNGLQQRLENTKNEETVTGITEVKKICNLRMRDLVRDMSPAKH